MPGTIQQFELHRLCVPAGRMIGDASCRYENFDVVLVRLADSDGLTGWGYGESVSEVIFDRSAPWFFAMPPRSDLVESFQTEWWKDLRGKHARQLLKIAPRTSGGSKYINQAVRIALWDLAARQAEQPLWKFLSGNPRQRRVKVYGSLLDFPLNEADAVELAKRYMQRGIRAIKVKVGGADAQRDIERLRAIREAVGPEIELTVDANETWTVEQAIERMELYRQNGVEPAYVEDPLPHDDVDGFKRLHDRVNVDLAGHDYAESPEALERLLHAGALDRLRVTGDLDHALACAALADRYQLPLVFGNSMFEMNIHAAVTMPRAERFEFPELAWNDLIVDPVRIENGHAIAPDRPGHGLEINPQVLEQWSRK